MIARLTFLSCALVAALAYAAAPARADILDTPTPQPAWTKTVGDVTVSKFGNGSPALVLIPGLSCGPWTWRDTIAREAHAHAIYAVTLPGFDGVPANPNATLETVETSLATLVTSENVDRPVVVGHSLGGYLALRFGIEHASLARGIVSVDGLPVMAQLANAPQEARNAAGDQFAAAVEGATHEQYQALQAKTIADYVVDPTLATHVTALSARSDPKAVAAFGKALFSSDLRPQLAALTVPTAVIAPVPGLPLPSYYPASVSAQSDGDRRAGIIAFYSALMAGTPSLKVLPVDGARHFVMLDKPDAFATALDGFIATLQ